VIEACLLFTFRVISRLQRFKAWWGYPFLGRCPRLSHFAPLALRYKILCAKRFGGVVWNCEERAFSLCEQPGGVQRERGVEEAIVTDEDYIRAVSPRRHNTKSMATRWDSTRAGSKRRNPWRAPVGSVQSCPSSSRAVYRGVPSRQKHSQCAQWTLNFRSVLPGWRTRNFPLPRVRRD